MIALKLGGTLVSWLGLVDSGRCVNIGDTFSHVYFGFEVGGIGVVYIDGVWLTLVTFIRKLLVL